MRMWPMVGGALLGGRALRLPGLFLGVGLGWSLAILLDLRERVEWLEARGRRRFPHRLEPRTEAPSAGARSESGERYPEEAVVNSLRESEGEELAGLYNEVTGRPT